MPTPNFSFFEEIDPKAEAAADADAEGLADIEAGWMVSHSAVAA
jgi:predicted transcriptional regulator